MSQPTFRQVYDEHFELVWRWLRRLGVREASVEDAAQEVFVVVYRRLAEFEGRSRISTWIFEICVRVAHAQRRADHARTASAGGNEVDVARPASDLIEHEQEMQVLGALLDELALEQRVVFVLYELEEMTGEQIAELLDLPMGTVWSRLRLARQGFRESIHRRTAQTRFELATVRGGT